jgi:hypothetical protein
MLYLLLNSIILCQFYGVLGFWGFGVLGGKKFFLKIFKNILETALKSYIKWLL